jgi:hypothetical protein
VPKLSACKTTSFFADDDPFSFFSLGGFELFVSLGSLPLLTTNAVSARNAEWESLPRGTNSPSSVHVEAVRYAADRVFGYEPGTF